jgi:hypothetical protein
MGALPHTFEPGELPHAQQLFALGLLELAINCAGDSLTIVNPMDAPDRYRVQPAEFLRWLNAKDYGPHIPEVLTEAVAEESGQQTTPAATGKLRTPQRHRERCRAIAQWLWDQEPLHRIDPMAKRSEILKYGCEGNRYGLKIVRDWIKDLCPNPTVGRPPKNPPKPPG